MKPLPSHYLPAEAEARLQTLWRSLRVYNWHNNTTREENFVIDTPPPTVSGLLHMGHIYSYTQADFVARYMRMRGKNVFYPMGFDDNGLPTERLVEKVKKVRASDMSREAFIALCEDVAAEARTEFRRLFESIALSVDWDQVYSTISKESRQLSQLSFLDLYHKGQAYRKLQPMLWDPVDQTAIAQAEIEDRDMPSHMREINFTCLETGETVVIATTRPELLGACVAVFFHPDDARYTHLKGRTAVTALFGVQVPILSDPEVKMEKGTGLVMCCTFGDETDIGWWRTHHLPTRIILDKYSKIRFAETPEGICFQNDDLRASITADNCLDIEKVKAVFNSLKGLKVSSAREKIVELLREANLLVKEQPINHAVKCAERSGATLEILPTNQWFIKVLEHKDALKEKARECQWNPEFMRVRMEQWIDGLSWDWCISRQRYFGVPFPVWYSKRSGEEGKILLADKTQLPVNPLVDVPFGYTREEVEPETDVMDTWATSSISPQLSSRAVTAEYAVDFQRHQALFPADLRPQAHEIIRTWAFYTLVKSYLHEQTIPWKNLMISGWCLAADKSKMSKSKGNVITPVGLIEEKGADVVRFWASTSRLGADTAYSEDVLKIGKKLITKLWNATRFAAIHLEKLTDLPATATEDVRSGVISQTVDKWILSRLHATIDEATQAFDAYEYCQAREAMERFFWKDFCDNYLELVKTRIYGEASGSSPEGQRSAIHTIYHCLDAVLRLFAPIVPHITEELYAHIFEEKLAAFGGSIHRRYTWPIVADYPSDEEAEAQGEACVMLLDTVRKIKARENISMKAPLAWAMVESSESISLDGVCDDLKHVINAEEVYLGKVPSLSGEALTLSSENNVFRVTVSCAYSGEKKI